MNTDPATIDPTTTAEYHNKVVAFQQEITEAEAELKFTSDPRRKAAIIWELAYVKLRDIEELRPAGGFPGGPDDPKASKPQSGFSIVCGIVFFLLVVAALAGLLVRVFLFFAS